MMKPYVTCFMMSSVDGRIDCAMTEQIEGSKEYYDLLAYHDFDACLCGKVTAKMHYAKDDLFIPSNSTIVGKEVYFKAIESQKYNVVVDTLGSLTWGENTIDGEPIIILLSEKTTIEYINYLKKLHISFIVVGENKINLEKALDYLYQNFNIKKLGIVGGGNINGAFLDAGLLDEISLLIGPGIDGRKGMTALFDGIDIDRKPYRLKLNNLKKYDNGVVWLSYKPD